MGKVLVEASKVTCGAAAPHQGTLTMTGLGRLVINGSKAVTTDGVLAATPNGCTNPGNAGGPCSKVAAMTAGASTRLTVDGAFVVLDSLQATTDRASAVKVDTQSINNDLLTAE